jgi:phosphoribosylglycinamide formyltransferase 1
LVSNTPVSGDAKATPRLRLAVFASGQGTNLENIYQKIQSGELQSVELGLVVSNNSAAGAMEFARSNGVAAEHISAVKFGDQAAADRATTETLSRHNIDLIVLAGYLKKLPDEVVRRYEGRIINVHPALLPSFGGAGMYGKHVHEAVLARGCKVSGATAHLVTEEYDEGPIILQEACAITDNETPQSLSRKVREIEFRLLPKAIDIIARQILSSRSH